MHWLISKSSKSISSIIAVGGECPNGKSDCGPFHNIECRDGGGINKCLCESDYSVKTGETNCTVEGKL